MASTGIQLYSLRDVEQSFDELLRTVADAGFDGVEFANRVQAQEPETVRALLDDTELEPIGAHVSLDRLEESFEETVEFYDAFDCHELVVPWLSADEFVSIPAIERTINRLEATATALEDEGMTLHYHNHDHEYQNVEGRPGFHRFIESTDLPIELDVGFVTLAGDDPVARIRDLGDRSRLLHLKDVDATSGESVPVGQGDLDVRAVADAFRKVDGDWLIYEYEGENPLDSLEEVASRMNQVR